MTHGLPLSGTTVLQPAKDMVMQGRGYPVLPGQSLILGYQGKAFICLQHGMWAVIDEADVPLIRGYTWTAVKKGVQTYVIRKRPKNSPPPLTVYLHREIMRPSAGEVVDHRDCNGLNNTRANLRLCTQSENNKNLPKPRTNTSGFKGVHYRKDRRKYCAQIRGGNGKIIRLGCFDNPQEAHKAYCAAAVQHHGEYARFE